MCLHEKISAAQPQQTKPASRFLFVCRHDPNQNDWDIADNNNELMAPRKPCEITVELSSGDAADILGFSNGVEQAVKRDFWKTQAFVRELIAHPDSRIRTEAARYECFTPDMLAVIKNDRSHNVRSNLINNSQVIREVSVSDILEMAGGDSELLVSALEMLCWVAREDLAAAEAKAEAAKKEQAEAGNSENDKMQEPPSCQQFFELVQALQTNTDPQVQDKIEELTDRFSDMSVRPPLPRRHRLKLLRIARSDAETKDAGKRQEAHEFLLGFAIGDTLELDPEKPAVQLDAEAVSYVIDRLEDAPHVAELLDVLTSYPSQSVLVSVAQSSMVTASVVETLSRMKIFNIREALLENAAALKFLSPAAVVDIIGGDPQLLRSACSFGDLTVEQGKEIVLAFKHSPDPFVQETLSDLIEDIKEKEKSQEDDFEL